MIGSLAETRDEEGWLVCQSRIVAKGKNRHTYEN